MQSLIVATDVGGTFTDVLAIDLASGSVFDAKVKSTPPAFDEGVVAGIRAAALRFSASSTNIPLFFHAATVGTNSILERSGPTVALVVTEGFRDVLEIGRARRSDLYNIGWSKPISLVPRDLCFEVSERMNAIGQVIRPLDEEGLKVRLDAAIDAGTQTLAIVFLHAYANDIHERMAAKIVAERAPALPFSLSADVCPERGEFERISTTVVNAYLKPTVTKYLTDLVSALQREFPQDTRRQCFMMQSNGGVVSIETTKDYPSRTIESGPAAGARGACMLGRLLGELNLIAFDMGGTTAKASLIENGSIFEAHEFQVGHAMSSSTRMREGDGYVVRVPCLDVAEVGLGGGTIAHADELGVLHVGPKSAGARPGPACYALDGDQPTVTDAHVVLGEIRQIAGGTVPLRPELAFACFERLSRTLRNAGMVETACMVLEVANEHMTGAIRAVTTDRGRDPVDFLLVAYGGAGPLHAVALAERLGLRRVLIPPNAGVFSAAGLLAAPLRTDVVRVIGRPLNEATMAHVRSIVAEHDLSTEGKRLAAMRPGRVDVRWQLMLRYEGQTHAIPIELGPHVTGEALEARFTTMYSAEFGYLPPKRIIEAMELRGTVEVNWNDDVLSQIFFRTGSDLNPICDRTHSPLLHHEITFVNRRHLEKFGSMHGPFIIEDFDSTIVVPAGWTAEIGRGATVWLSR